MRRLFKLLVFAVIIIPLLLTGCAPSRELKDLAIVEGVGIDLNPDGSYLLTFQIFKAQSSGGGNGDKQSASNQTEIVQSTGKGLFDASRNATLQMGKKLYFSNVRAIILGKDVCANKFALILDFLERNHEIRADQGMLMTQGRAEDILKTKNEDGYITAQKIALILKNNYNTSKIIDKSVIDLLQEQSMGITDPSMAVISIIKMSPASSSQSGASQSGSSGDENNVVLVEGTAIFNNNKFVSVLNDSETRGLLWIMGKVNSGVLIVKTSSAGTANLEIDKSNAKVSTFKENDKVGIKIDISFITSLTEVEDESIKDINPTEIEKLIDLQNKLVKSEIQSAIDKALRQNNSDIFAFGLKIFQSNPDDWRKISDSWNESAGSLPVQINVTSTFNDSGLITK